MNALPSARAVGILILAVGMATAGFASAASQPTSDAITDMVAATAASASSFETAVGHESSEVASAFGASGSLTISTY